MRGQIKLNNVYYKTKGLPSQTIANQMASKVGQGSSEYGDLTNWSAWVEQDWQRGVGKLKPHREQGGMLYSEAESKVPGQLILPQLIRLVGLTNNTNNHNVFTTFDTPVTVGVGQTVVRGAVGFFTGATTLASHKYWIYANIPIGTTLTFALYTNSGSFLPNTLITSTTYTQPETNPGWYWHGVSLTAALSTATTYWLVVYPNSGTFTWARGQTLESNCVVQSAYYTGSVFDYLGNYFSIANNHYPLATTTTQAGAGFFRFNGQLYCYSNARLYKYDTAPASGVPEWDSVGAITGITAVTGVTVFDSTAYFGNEGGDGDYTTMSTGEVFTDTGVGGKIFTKWKNLLWRANANYVEYSDDGTTWEPTASLGDPIYVSDTSNPVTGLCGMGDLMYAATQNGLVPIYGNTITGGITWGSFGAQNGIKMVEFEGALYIVVNGRVVRYTEDGTMQDVWMTRDDDVLASRIGKVWDLAVTNNWLFALVEATVTNGKPTIWAYQDNGWHHFATLPNSTSSVTGIAKNFSLFYDKTTQRLWCITPDFCTFNWYISDYSLNPYNDTASRYTRTAWVEWDWFDGAILEAPKDYDSVTILGENLSSTCYVEVYWKDDASTGWEFLGTADSNIEELRWTLASGTRPSTKRLKLGLLLHTKSAAATPRIRAVRVKYHLMVRDWFRWTFAVDVSGRTGALQMTNDGTRHTLTASQIKSNLDALAKQTPPFVYQDVDGTQYEVKVTDANFQYTQHEYNENTTNEWWEGVYNLVIEQVTQGTYS